MDPRCCRLNRPFNTLYDFYLLGLGNPEPRYQDTRHNLGFAFLTFLAGKLTGLKPIHKKNFPVLSSVADCKGGLLEGQRLLLVWPKTYMNASGRALTALCRELNFDSATQLLVIYDDLDLPLGALRLRQKGSAGTHRGMASLLEVLPGGHFMRLRLGIGPKPQEQDAAEFVLSVFTAREKQSVAAMLEKAANTVQSLARDGIQLTLSRHRE